MTEQSIFMTALDLVDPHQRESYIDSACGGDEQLRSRVLALLAANEVSDSFLEVPAFNQIESDEKSPAVSNTASIASSVLPLLQSSTDPKSLGRFGVYEIYDVLGEGGFGVVFKGVDSRLERFVAIKMLSPQLAATSPPRKRFLREARSAAQIRNDNVVGVYDVAEEPLPYLVMEYVPGETLQQRIDRVGPLSLDEILHIGKQVALGLAAAHALNLVHRDVKPGNILLEPGPYPRVKLTDFGLARAADDASLTQSGLLAGTPLYMSPEQANGGPIDSRSDLFSFGSVLYVMCTGRPPFRASNTFALLRRVVEENARPVREVIPEIPQWLEDLIALLHAKLPDDRIQSAGEVAELLGNRGEDAATLRTVRAKVRSPLTLAAFERIAANREPTAAQRRRPWNVPAIVIGVLVCIFAVPALLSWANRGSHLPSNGPTTPNASAPAAQGVKPAAVPDKPLEKVAAKLPEPSTPPEASLMEVELPKPTVTGAWFFEGDDLVTEGQRDQRSVFIFGDPKWEEYDLRVEVMEEETREEGKKTMENSILVHADDAGTSYWKIDVGAFSSSKHFDLLPIVEGEYPWKSPGRRFRANLLHGRLREWFRVEVQVRKTNIAVTVNGVPIASSEHAKLTHGRIGASSFNVGRARWRNFEVLTPDGKSLWKGFPELPHLPHSDTKSIDFGTAE